MSFKICLVIAALLGSVSVGYADSFTYKYTKPWGDKFYLSILQNTTVKKCSGFLGRNKKSSPQCPTLFLCFEALEKSGKSNNPVSLTKYNVGPGTRTLHSRYGPPNRPRDPWSGVYSDNSQITSYNQALAEVKRRGLSASQCFKIVKNFFYNPPNNTYFQRGTDFRLQPSEVRPQKTGLASTLKRYFNSHIISDRKLIQSNLKKLGYYKSSIDGLYGKGTIAALKTYNYQNFNAADLTKTTNVTKLLNAVLASVAKKTCSRLTPEVCATSYLCKRATITNNLKLEWDTYISAKPYLNEAKKRGLTCGVKVQTTTPKVAPTPTPKVVEVPKPITESEAVKFRRIKKELSLNYYGGFIHSDRLPNTLFFFTDIKKNDSLKFRKALRNHDIDLIVLSSPGGSVFEGLQIAGIIHDKKLKTYIPKKSLHDKGNCASACSYMFFAGESRSAEGDLGVHQFYSTKASDEEKIGAVEEDAQFTVSEIIGFLNEFETPAWVYERMFQQADMYYFKERELLQLETEVSEETKALHEKAERFISDFRSAFVKVKD